MTETDANYDLPRIHAAAEIARNTIDDKIWDMSCKYTDEADKHIFKSLRELNEKHFRLVCQGDISGAIDIFTQMMTMLEEKQKQLRGDRAQ